eukprot:COSAG01_NODE_5385_length_4293_cov_19.521221_4_plen_196_part_00
MRVYHLALAQGSHLTPRACLCVCAPTDRFSSVRTKLDDPRYSDWFIRFSGKGNYSQPACDTNWSPPKCSQHWHDQDQSPGTLHPASGYPKADGTCAKPCFCGDNPCGAWCACHVGVRTCADPQSRHSLPPPTTPLSNDRLIHPAHMLGEYIFNHASTTRVQNSSFAEWFLNEWMISNETLLHPGISGMLLDDHML